MIYLGLGQGWGAYLLSRAAQIVDYRWQAANNNLFYSKSLPLSNNDFSWHPSLSTCLSWSFVLTRFLFKIW